MHQLAGSGRSIDEVLASFSESELREIHQKISERLRLLYNVKQATALTQFSRGDRVMFMHNGERLTGTVVRLNRKTVSVHTDDHQNWNVAPSVLHKLIEND